VTKEELQDIADTIVANWNINLTPEARKNFYRTWWRYLGDLNAGESRAAVDTFILADRPLPGLSGAQFSLRPSQTSLRWNWHGLRHRNASGP
jgi:hypothetical protein